MRILRPVVRCGLVVLLICLLWPLSVWADPQDPILIDPDLLVAAGLAPDTLPSLLMVQATSWGSDPYRYVVTLGNFTPWPLVYISLLDRYLPADPEQPSQDQQWFPERLDSGQVASFVFEFPDGPMEGACHQIELQLADGLGTILMDCSAPSTTTVWQVRLTSEMEAYLALPELTLEEPEGRSKLGLHVTSNNDPAIMAFVRDAYPAAVVAVGDLGWLADVKEESPDTVTIGRFAEDDQTMSGDPAAKAREFVAEYADQYLANPGVDYWLGWNEPVVKTAAQMAWYAEFEAERAAAMAELGLHVAIGNFAVGTPEADVFSEFLPAITAAKQYDGIMALHEYSAPTMQDGVGAIVPGVETQDDYGALTLRYRYWYQHYLSPNDLVIPLVVTEAGIDGGVLSGETAGGWRDFAAVSSSDASEVDAGSYTSQLSWYDDELRRDPYVIGFAIFNAGDPDGRWESFDVTDILPELTEIVQSKE